MERTKNYYGNKFALVGGLDVSHVCDNNNNPKFWPRVGNVDVQLFFPQG